MKNRKNNVPFLAEWILSRASKPGERFSILGDLREEYTEKSGKTTTFSARCWYWKQAVKAVPAFLRYAIFGNTIMITNYIKVALRNLLRHKVYSAINISGLSFGLVCSMLIYLYVSHELSFDRFHENSSSIYRVVRIDYNKDGSIREKQPHIALPMLTAIKDYYPEIKHLLLYYDMEAVIKNEEKVFTEDVTFASASFFDVFSFRLLRGNPASALSADHYIVLTEEAAKKYFGEEDPMGKSLTLIFGKKTKVFEISGIVRNIPENSSVKFKVLINYENTKIAGRPGSMETWSRFYATGFIQLKEGVFPDVVDNRFDDFVGKYFGRVISRMKRLGWFEGEGLPFTFALQPMAAVHLDGSVKGSNGVVPLYILLGIGFMVLCIACINFMNLSIGRSVVRSVEIGLRKVVGAEKKQLLLQFYIESLLVTSFAAIMGLILTYFSLPVFNELSGKELSLSEIINPVNIAALLMLVIITGLFSGSYPALVMSRLKIVEVLKGKVKFGNKNTLTRSMVIFQFSLSILLIITTIIGAEQIAYLNNRELGYEKNGVIVVNVQESSAIESETIIGILKNKILPYASILSVSRTSDSFGKGSGGVTLSRDEKRIRTLEYRVDHDYIKTLGITLLEGRNFSPGMQTDSTAIIVNQKLLDELEDQFLPGKPLPEYGNRRVVGVISDYNTLSLKEEIEPVILMLNSMPRAFPYKFMLVKIAPQNISPSIDIIKKAWEEVQPNKPFQYSFLDEDVALMYENERKWGAIVSYASTFAIIIACLGVFGLTSIAVSRRIKEVGIRKVLGAKVLQVITLIINEFLLLIVCANILAWPFAYYIMDNVLSGYHYRIGISIHYFLFAGGLSIGVALFTMMYQVLKAAIANPVKSLRYE